MWRCYSCQRSMDRFRCTHRYCQLRTICHKHQTPYHIHRRSWGWRTAQTTPAPHLQMRIFESKRHRRMWIAHSHNLQCRFDSPNQLRLLRRSQQRLRQSLRPKQEFHEDRTSLGLSYIPLFRRWAPMSLPAHCHCGPDKKRNLPIQHFHCGFAGW